MYTYISRNQIYFCTKTNTQTNTCTLTYQEIDILLHRHGYMFSRMIRDNFPDFPKVDDGTGKLMMSLCLH